MTQHIPEIRKYSFGLSYFAVVMIDALAPTVLLVEDELIIRMAVADGLEANGLRVLEADDGEEALNLIGNHPEITVLVTDIRLPGIDGITLAKRASADIEKLTVILASGGEPPSDPPLLARWRFIRKPYAATHLLRLIRQTGH